MDTLISYCHEQCQFVLVGTKQDLNSQNTQILNQFFLELQQKYQNLKLLLTVSTYNEDSIKQAFQKTFELGASLDKSSITILQSFILQRNENYSVLKKCSDRESKVQKHENCC
ncbi:unnamed protein product [Paramecium pentaurelia]|uniref:Uncharacterized protein n=1 Tax=Paramecium pentaurelia TaxID=43138 RepID=A0A8S1W5Q1_9CILI|nr:unnamed protein product [Paramecium pentaurelia]